jgi:hypothetical protein
MKTKRQIRKTLPLLDVLKRASHGQSCILLAHLDEEGCNAVYDCVAIVLSGKNISKRKRSSLLRILEADRQNLRFIANPKKSLRQKRKKLTQVGGSIKHILTSAIPILLKKQNA